MDVHGISKVFAPLLDPRAIAFVVLVLGVGLLWTQAKAAGRFLVTLVTAASLMLGALPVGAFLFSVLEERFPPLPLPDHVDGIVLLGGEVNPLIYGEQPESFSGIGSGARLFAFLALARRYPSSRLVFSGGPGRLSDPSSNEAEAVRDLLGRTGFDISRLTVESESRTTHENAVSSLKVAAPAAAQRWLIITSAIHMPRAIGSFRGAGWENEDRRLYPYPVDFRSGPGFNPGIPSHFHAGFDALARALYEWAALAAYYRAGRMDAFLPAPR